MDFLQRSKVELRLAMRAKRKMFSAQTASSECVESVSRQLFAWSAYQNAVTILFYVSMPDEFPTEDLIRHALGARKNVCVPLFGLEQGRMEAAQILDLAELQTGQYGVRMPDASGAKRVAADEIDFIVVPGLCFDRKGSRLGFGAGYYDRYLPTAPRAVRLGLAWSFQLVEKVPTTEFDVAMDFLLTEAGFWDCERQIASSKQNRPSID